MSPTVFRHQNYRFYFFSREESRMHIHIYSSNGEAKFWLEPEISLAYNHGLRSDQLKELEKVVKERQDECRVAWKKFFSC